ncbi:MAG: CDP-glucose 4,6-dehydratase [Selenomonadaceae bacterium]|nr:CDP-glucose 4,6-dehydratase [Selenomonadaceae bacterium]
MKYQSEKFWRGKRVFVTGHTGFKGMWLCRLLAVLGAEVFGYALEAPTAEGAALLKRKGISDCVRSTIGDIRDLDALTAAMREAQPEIVLHLAAQPIVSEGYRAPVLTYSTNVLGTVHILECVKQMDSVRSFVNVTTDKVYENREWAWAYRECDSLDGFDPYANSKSCSELVTRCYRRSFFSDRRVAISTMRAGNVIGGGDFSLDRIVPDCIRAAIKKEAIAVRNPQSIRPYQHVLDPVYAYLLIAEEQYKDPHIAGSYNIGPNETDCVTTGTLVSMFCELWGEGQTWRAIKEQRPHEAHLLRLDCALLQATLGWTPRWNIRKAMEKTVAWTKVYLTNGDVAGCMDQQIGEFLLGGEGNET